MYYVKNWACTTKLFLLLYFVLIFIALSGCQDITDDLIPSGDDQRLAVETGSSGNQPGQVAPAFTEVDTLNLSHTLADELVLTDGVVLYFTMWCPICDSHMSHIRSKLIPDFPNVGFLVIDYVTGSVEASRSAQLANGYSDFTVLADSEHTLYNTFDGGMGITVVIDADGTVVLNEDYKDGAKVRAALESL